VLNGSTSDCTVVRVDSLRSQVVLWIKPQVRDPVVLSYTVYWTEPGQGDGQAAFFCQR
jgi:hypothetical protein